jgi:hypothetical protein
MPGIYGVASASRRGLNEITDKMLSEVLLRRDARRFVRDAVHTAGFSGFSLVNRSFSDLKMPYEDADVLVLFDGNLFNLDEIGLGDSTYAEAAAALYKAKGEKFASELRGHFVMALLDKRGQVLRVYGDPFATKPVYYMHDGGALYFASELKALLPVGPLPKHADPRALNNIVLGGYPITFRTLVREASALKDGGMIAYDLRSDRLSAGQYLDLPQEALDLPYKEHFDRITEASLRAFERPFRHAVSHGRKIFITITGGKDSRALAAFAAKNFGPPIFGITHRFHDDYETDLAERVCHVLGINQIRVPLDAGDTFRQTIDDAVCAGEAMAHFSDVWRFTAALKGLSPEEFGTLHTGIPGCITYGSFLRPWHLKHPERRIQSPGYSAGFKEIAQKFAHFTHPESNRMFLDAVGDGTDRFAMLKEDLCEIEAATCTGATEWATIRERTILQTRQMRGSVGAFRGIEEYMDFSAPFWDVDLMRATRQVPAKMKVGAALYYDFMRTRLFSRRLRRLPFTRNFGPMRKHRPVSWFESKFKKRFLRGFLGRFIKNYRRLYGCSYQYVIREDPSLRSYMADNLLALPSPEAFGIDSAKWRDGIERWRRDPLPYIHLTRHFFWLLFFKRWHDFWGKYVSL